MWRISLCDHDLTMIHGQIMVKSWSDHGQIMVRSWSDHGQIMVRSWSDHGQIMVRSWSDHGQIMVKSRSVLTKVWPWSTMAIYHKSPWPYDHGQLVSDHGQSWLVTMVRWWSTMLWPPTCCQGKHETLCYNKVLIGYTHHAIQIFGYMKSSSNSSDKRPAFNVFIFD